jgi:hypothetical protein
MTTKILSGTYPNGYVLAAKYSGVSITGTGSLTGMPGAEGTATTSGGNGGPALSLAAAGSVINSGRIVGGAGGNAYGYYGAGLGGEGVLLSAKGTVTNYSYIAGGVDGGGTGGGAGVVLEGGGRVANLGTIRGGGGDGYVGEGIDLVQAGTISNGDASHTTSSIYGGVGVYASALAIVVNYGSITSGGYAGAGVQLDGGGSIVNHGLIRGGQGVAGFYTYPGDYLAPGPGGAAILLWSGGSVLNQGSIVGGAGGSGPNEGMAGGDGVDLAAGGTVTNLGQILGGAGGSAYNYPAIGRQGFGVSFHNGGRLTNGAAGAASALIQGYVGVYAAGTVTVVNFGSIDGTVASLLSPGGGFSVEFKSAADRLVAESGSSFVAPVAGGGGTFELAAGNGTITGLGKSATVTGAVTADFGGFGTYVLDAGGAWTLTGANSLAAGNSLTIAATLTDPGALSNHGTVDQTGIVTLSGAGSIINAAGATWNLGNGIVLASGGTARFVNTGRLNRLATSGLNNFTAGFTNTGVVDIAGGTLAFSGPANSLAGTVVGAGTLSLAGGTTSLVSGLHLLMGAISIKGATTKVTVNENLGWLKGWTQLGGLVSVASGDRLTLSGVADAFSGTLTGAGTVYFSSGSDSFKSLTLSAAQMVISNASVALAGPIVLSRTVVAIGARLTIAATGAVLSGGGTLTLNGAANTVKGATVTDPLTNVDDRIQGAGQLGDAQMALVNDTGGVIDGNATTALTIDLGANTLANAGLIENTAAGGTSVTDAVANTGTLMVTAGTLSVMGAVTGAGTVKISGGVADFGSTFTENVTFAGSTGVLELAHSQTYTGTITGLSKTGASSLDLADIGFTSGVTKASFSGASTSGTLTVTDGTHTAHIKLAGDYLGSTWTLTSDGHGGTKIVDPAAAVGAAPLATAMAAFGVTPSPEGRLPTHALPTPISFLAVAHGACRGGALS